MDYKSKTIAELRELAKEKGIRNVSGMRKQELAELLENVEKMMRRPAESPVAEAKPVEETKPAAEAKPAAETRPGAETKPAGAKLAARPGRPRSAKPATTASPVTKPATTAPSAPKTAEDRSVAPRPAEERTQVQKPAEERPVEAAPAEAKGQMYDGQEFNPQMDTGSRADGILEVMAEGFGFIRSDNYMPGEKDIYVSPAQIRKFGLKTGDIIAGPVRKRMQPSEKFQALLYIESVNGQTPSEIEKRKSFDSLTPIFPEDRIRLDYNGAPVSLRIVDLFSPIGKGQRGMIVSPPKAGKTTLLKQIAKRISVAYPEIHLLVLLIDERPEEVTDIKESIVAKNAEVIYSTFDELPEHHKRVSEMVIERAKRMVESGKDVVILLDSLTRLARAYNLTVTPSGRTLSGGLDPAALHMPKKFFGAARNMREGGSLTILATALIETGSRMDDVVFEEFKGTGNMELVLNRSLSERRVFPAIDIAKSGTRRDDLLLSNDEREVLDLLHQQLRGTKAEEATEEIIKLFGRTRNNMEFLDYARKMFSRSIR